MEPATTCDYDLDDDFRIIRVGADWSEFAVRNQAPELASPPGPLGQSALACVSDKTSALLFERLFRRVLQTGRALALPIRCDAPTRRRYLNLRIVPRIPAGLRIETSLTRAEERPPVALLERHRPRGSDLLRMCGWCKSVDVAGRWREVEDAVAELRLFERDPLPRVSHGICPPCGDRVSQELERP